MGHKWFIEPGDKGQVRCCCVRCGLRATANNLPSVPLLMKAKNQEQECLKTRTLPTRKEMPEQQRAL